MHKLDDSLLAPLPPFSRLQSGQIREILDQATPRRFDAGATIFEANGEAGTFFLLLDGYVRVIRTTVDGDQVVVLHIPSGQLFGFAKAIGRTTYPATAVAAADCVALTWPMRLWDEFVRKYDGFSTVTYKTIGERMEEIQDRIVEMSTLHVEQRVANALLRLIRQTGRKTDEGITIDFPITRQDISEMSGTTLHTVSRLLSSWEKQGVVLSKRKKITVTDAHRLVVFSEAGVAN